MALTETKALERCYNWQKKGLGVSHKTQFEQDLGLEFPLSVDKQHVNFVEHGSLLAKIPDPDSGLAIDEISVTIRSNLNFMNSECLQTLSLDGGLANLTASTHYQLTHKQLLQVAVQTNYMILLPILKAQIEIELLTEEGLQLPNGALSYDEITVGHQKAVQLDRLKQVKTRIQVLKSTSGNSIENLLRLKGETRMKVQKLWEKMLVRLQEAGHKRAPTTAQLADRTAHPINVYSQVKLLHDYKLKLANIAARELHKHVLNNAIKVQTMYVTHCELKQRLNYFAGLKPEHQPFQFEKGYATVAEPRYICAGLNCSAHDNLIEELHEDEDNVSSELLRVIPSVKSIQRLPVFTKLKEKWPETQQSLLDRYQSSIEYSEFHLELLVYKNISAVFDMENQNYSFLKLLFPAPVAESAKTNYREVENYLQFAKRYSLPYKVFEIYRHMLTLFEFTLFTFQTNVKPVDLIDVQAFMDQDRQYWTIDEAKPAPLPQATIPGELVASTLIEDMCFKIEDSTLSQKIVDRVTNDIRTQNTIIDEITAVAKEYKKLVHVIGEQYRKTESKLENFIAFLRDLNHINHMKLLKKELISLDLVLTAKTQDEDKMSKRYQTYLANIQKFGSHDLSPQFYLNGLVLNPRIFATESIPLRYNSSIDSSKFKRSVKGLQFYEDHVPMSSVLVHQVFDAKNFSEDLQAQYPGQLHYRHGCLIRELRYCYIHLGEKESNQVQQVYHQQESLLHNLLFHEDMESFSVKESLVSYKLMSILETLICSIQYKFCLLMSLAGKCFPERFDEETLQRDFIDLYHTHASWKVSKYADAETARFKDLKQTRERKRKEAERRGLEEAVAVTSSAIQEQAKVEHKFGATISKFNIEEAFSFYLKYKCLKTVLRTELEKLLT